MFRSIKTVFILLLSISLFSCKSADKFRQAKTSTLLFSDNFDKGFDTSAWISEIAPESNSNVYVKDGKLFLDTLLLPCTGSELYLSGVEAE